jgi:hypothetical protein
MVTFCGRCLGLSMNQFGSICEQYGTLSRNILCNNILSNGAKSTAVCL